MYSTTLGQCVVRKDGRAGHMLRLNAVSGSLGQMFLKPAARTKQRLLEDWTVSSASNAWKKPYHGALAWLSDVYFGEPFLGEPADKSRMLLDGFHGPRVPALLLVGLEAR